jgi:hypothetical protein
LAQVAEHPSPLVVLPSSHCSPGSSFPSPHVALDAPSFVHVAEQPSPLTTLPSSHSSPGSIAAFPHFEPPVALSLPHAATPRPDRNAMSAKKAWFRRCFCMIGAP